MDHSASSATAAGLLLGPAVQATAGDVLAPLVAYVAGHRTGDADHHRRAFLSTAHVEGIRDGAFVSWSLEDYCARFDGVPARDEDARRRRLDEITTTGSVGSATMTLHHGDTVFTDVFVLLRVDGAWRIANKAYHAEPADPVR